MTIRSLSQRFSIGLCSLLALATLAANARSGELKFEDVLEWLPADTETLIVARGPFTTPALPGNESAGQPKEQPKEAAKPIGWFQIEAFAGYRLPEEKYYAPIQRRTVTLAVSGSRKFRVASIPGYMSYEGCRVAVFADGLGEARKNLVKMLESDAKKIHDVGTQRVYEFSKELNAAEWKYLVALPDERTLLVGTHLGYVSEVIKRMKEKGAERALPAKLPEWRELDKDAPGWALRHFTHKPKAEENPILRIDAQAIGVVAYPDSKRERVVIVKELSDSKSAVEEARERWSNAGDGFEPEAIEALPKGAKIIANLDKEEAFSNFFFQLAWSLGHGVLP